MDMRKLGCCVSAICLLVALGSSFSGNPQTSTRSNEDPNISEIHKQLKDCPAEIVQLAIDIRGKNSQEIQDLFIKRYGEPDGDLGSGLSIPFWNRCSGRLVNHPCAGPSFNGKSLIATHNRILETLMTGFEMTTPMKDEMCAWIGNIAFNRKRMRYVFTDSDNNEEYREGLKKNFFQKHPTGTIEIVYLKGLNANSLLEAIPDQTVVCNITFTSKDRKTKITYPIISSRKARYLRFAKCEKEFQMDTCWPNAFK
jgi:hypothetical protein